MPWAAERRNYAFGESLSRLPHIDGLSARPSSDLIGLYQVASERFSY